MISQVRDEIQQQRARVAVVGRGVDAGKGTDDSREKSPIEGCGDPSVVNADAGGGPSSSSSNACGQECVEVANKRPRVDSDEEEVVFLLVIDF